MQGLRPLDLQGRSWVQRARHRPAEELSTLEDRADAALASAVRGGLFGGEASGRSFRNAALGAGGARL